MSEKEIQAYIDARWREHLRLCDKYGTERPNYLRFVIELREMVATEGVEQEDSAEDRRAYASAQHYTQYESPGRGWL